MNHFAPGSVIYFAHAAMVRDPEVTCTRWADEAPPETRPFLCLRVNGAAGEWIALTTRQNGCRIPIAPADKGGVDFGNLSGWTSRPSFVDDPSMVWTIPNRLVATYNTKPRSRYTVHPRLLEKVIEAVDSPHAMARRVLPGGKAGALKA